MQFDIKTRRMELGLTLEEVGKFVGVSKGTVSKWECGFIKNMRCDKIKKLSKILQVCPVVFLASEGYVEKSENKKNVHLNEGQKRAFEDLMLSVFGTSNIENTVITYEDNHLILLDL